MKGTIIILVILILKLGTNITVKGLENPPEELQFNRSEYKNVL